MSNIRSKNPFYDIRLSEFSVIKVQVDLFIDSICNLIPFNKNATYLLKEIEVTDISPLTKFVYSYRLSISRQILAMYMANKIPVFHPALLKKESIVQLIVPPIVEIHKNNLVVCDGMHRIVTCMRCGFKKIWVLLVDKKENRLPGDINNWSKVFERQDEVQLTDNFINYKPEYLSGYTFLFNSTNMWQDGFLNLAEC